MLLLHDRASMERALTLGLDPHLHSLLKARIDTLVTPDGDLTEWTEFLVVEPNDTETDIIRDVGFSPMVEPVDGIRFGEAGFHEWWDRLIDHHGWFEMIVTFGSTFAYVLLIQDADDVDAGLLALCRAYAV